MVNPMQYATQLQHMTANPGAYERKGWSPYELLGLKLPTSDWWQLLQMDPKEL